MAFDEAWLAGRVMILIPLWLSLSVHEWAHAFAARSLGDDTAEKLGRLTLNPIAHLDPVGTVLLPLLGVPFGWAKPVPIQPHRFHSGVSMRGGLLWTAAAGPLSNLVLAAACLAILGAAAYLQPASMAPGEAGRTLLETMIFLNVLLAVFNILPIPPLDGSRVLDALVPQTLRPAWEGFCRLGPLALAAVILLPVIAGVDLFGWPMSIVQHLIDTLPLPRGE